MLLPTTLDAVMQISLPVFNLQNSHSTSATALPYNHKGAQVHLVDLFDPGATNVKCFRCERSLPIEQFQPLFGVSSSLTGLRRSVRRKTALHPHCAMCRQQQMGQWIAHPKYSPDLDRYWSGIVSRIYGGARGRGLLVAIDKDDLLGLFLKQEGRCALTGIEMDWRAKGGAGRGNKALAAPSVDRIDSHGNYTLDNIQIVMAAVNVMKNDLSTDQFVALCEQVVAHRLAGG
jgi:hypothetical protein